MANGVRITDGSTSFEGGVDSGRIPTIEGPQNPKGLRRNQLSFAGNCTMRGGGITQRAGWLQSVVDFAGDNGLFQGGALYIPDSAVPYIIAAISGRIYRFDVWTTGAVSIIDGGLIMPAGEEKFFFCQAENIMVIQAGDFVTLPLFWNGTTMRRSNGIITPGPGHAGAVYSLDPTLTWVVPAVGPGSVTITLASPYPGQIGDTGTYGVIGTFEVTNIVGNTVDFRTLQSNYVGATIASTPATFTVAAVVGSPGAGTSEIPAGKTMAYAYGRLWVQVSNREYTAGDIAFRGAVPYNRQSFLQFTENAYLAGGGRFNVPSQAGSITAMFTSSELDTATGTGQLFIGTHNAIYALNVPVSRSEWQNVNNDAGMPLQRVVNKPFGPVSDRCIVNVNSDNYYQAYNGVLSLQLARRYYGQPGQVPISRNENRVLLFNDRSFYRFASGIEFDNRLLMTALPFQTPVGIAHKGLMPLDFDLLSSLDSRDPPAWEGLNEGVDIMQLMEASSGGLQRAFTFVHSQETGRIQIWEITNHSKFETGDKRVTWYFETPAFTWGNLFQLKKLDSAELWLDRIFGTVDIQVDYRPDQSPCWINWHLFQKCAARNDCDTETVSNPACYPTQTFRECYGIPLVLPKPPDGCEPCNGRPTSEGFQFQVRITIKGFCRVRGILVYAVERDRQPYKGLTC